MATVQKNARTPAPHTLGAFRACPHGHAIAYRATLETQGAEAVQMILTAMSCEPFIRSSEHADRYAVLDILDTNGAILDTRDIPDKTAFDKIRDSLALKVTASDCDHGCQ